MSSWSCFILVHAYPDVLDAQLLWQKEQRYHQAGIEDWALKLRGAQQPRRMSNGVTRSQLTVEKVERNQLASISCLPGRRGP